MDNSNGSSESRLINFNKPTPDFNRKFYDLLTQKSMVDVTLSADGQFLQAHKVVLAVASSWFEELFDALQDKHPVIVLKDLSIQQLTHILEFIYLGNVAVHEDDVYNFKTTLDALRISIDDSENENEVEDEEEHQQMEADENEIEQQQEEEEEIEKVEEATTEVEIKKEPEWDKQCVIKEEEKSNLKVASVISTGSIRIRTPASINEKLKIVEAPKNLKIVHKLPPPTPPQPERANIQELSKRLSKAILIRRVKKSDGSFVSERSPVKIIQGVKIQKIGNTSAEYMQHRVIPMRPQQQFYNTINRDGEKRSLQIFKCSHCQKSFSVNKRRNAHEKFCFKNPSRPSSQCPYCTMVLCNPMYIATHIRKVHGMDEQGRKVNDGNNVTM